MPGIRHRTTVYPGLGSATPHVAQVQDGNMFVEFGPDDTLSVVGPPERLVRWAKEFIAVVEDAEMEAGIDSAFEPERRETRCHAAVHVMVGEEVLCPDGEYRKVGRAERRGGRVVFHFADGTDWQGNVDDNVPVVIRTAERSA